MSHIPGLNQLRDGLPWAKEAHVIINNAIKRLNLTNPPGMPDAVNGASYTLKASDAYHTVRLNSASAQTITIPANSNVPYEIGTVIGGLRLGTGLVTFSPAGGVTFRKPTGIKPNRFMGAAVSKAADQTTADYTAESVVTWDQEIYDTDAWHDNATNPARLTVPSGFGIKKVSVSGYITTTLDTANEFSRVILRKNGTNVWDGAPSVEYDAPSTAARAGVAGVGFNVTDADYFELAFAKELDASITVFDRSGMQIQAEAIDAQGTIAYQYGKIELLKIGTDEWVISDSGLG